MSSEPRGLTIRVLNMAHDHGRRQHMEVQLQALGLSARFLPAIDGLTPAAARPASCALSAGEWGCYLSHRQAWLEQVAAGEPWGLVLEDDLHLDPALPQRLDKIRQHWPSGLHGVRLGHLCPAVGRLLWGEAAGICLVLPIKNPSGGQGYLLSLDGALRLAKQLRPRERPLDSELDHAWQHGIALGLLLPAVVWPDAKAVSRIGTSGRAHTSRSHAMGARWMRSIRKHLALARLMHRMTGRISAYWQAPTVRARVPDEY
ncbi:glycosyltransferase family 25 protein [Piscinibacter sp. Jin2]|uniref:Glycosyltransferase family 25 protein n=1 Tax=Aquariibacter lacus TaxID=2801332 RepID=A0A9X0XGJ5_9BURK|nr:glycosyltransferase family 25 protein [Piscinibacter lacus]MBL0719533.1 glycosyltransferase family 25 protein [Piscinibacter lacus]